MLEISYQWADVGGAVRVIVGTNEDPAALGCAEFARGFPYCRATVESPAGGYADLLGWVQLVDHSAQEGGFQADPFPRLSGVSHPYGFFGLMPTFFDAPHTNELKNWDFLAHTFLCGLGGDLLDPRREVRAVLGFSWGFAKRGARIDWWGPELLAAKDWDSQNQYLTQRYSEASWTFRPGFSQHPLEP